MTKAEALDLSQALLTRFVSGVEKGEFVVVALGSARALSVGPQIAAQIGDVDPDRLVLLVAERIGSQE